MSKHVVLLGDSIFDNRAYTNGGPTVIDHVRTALPDWQATLLAADGSIMSFIPRQLSQLPVDTSHLVISIGGNNAIMLSHILSQSANSFQEVLLTLFEMGQKFQQEYHEMLQTVLSYNLPTILCTIYDPNFPEKSLQQSAIAALTILNDAIIKEATVAGLPLIDLRLVCNEPTDYANEIEPSATGGAKIGAAVAKAVTQHDFSMRRTQIFV
jgi:hypothetical protein